jgi:hypothetical protein
VRLSAKWKIIIGGVVLLALYLLGFVPQFQEKRRLESELVETESRLSAAQRKIEIDQLRIIAGRILLEGTRQNYGLAQEHSTEYFNKLQDLAAKTTDAGLQAPLSELLKERDSITSGLAQGDAAIMPDVLSLLERTHNLPGEAAAQ